MQNTVNIIKTSGHRSLEKYTSHFFERVRKGYEEYYCARGELETEQNCNILTLTLMAITALLSRSPGLLNRGPHSSIFSPTHLRLWTPTAKSGVLRNPSAGCWVLGAGFLYSILTPTDLNFLSPGLYNNLTPTYFLRASQFRTHFNPSTVKVAPDILISSTGCTCYLHRCISYFDSLAGSEVNIQHFEA